MPFQICFSTSIAARQQVILDQHISLDIANDCQNKNIYVFFQWAGCFRRIPMKIHSFGARITCRYCLSYSRPRVASLITSLRNDIRYSHSTVSFLIARATAGAALGPSGRRMTCFPSWGQRSWSRSSGTWFPLASKTRAPFF